MACCHTDALATRTQKTTKPGNLIGRRVLPMSEDRPDLEGPVSFSPFTGPDQSVFLNHLTRLRTELQPARGTERTDQVPTGSHVESSSTRVGADLRPLVT